MTPDRYWDFRTCSWSGGQVHAPDDGPAAGRAGVLPALPAQTTAERVEFLGSPPERSGAALT